MRARDERVCGRWWSSSEHGSLFCSMPMTPPYVDIVSISYIFVSWLLWCAVYIVSYVRLHVCLCVYARIADVSHVWLLIRNLFVRAIYDHPTVLFIRTCSVFTPPVSIHPQFFSLSHLSRSIICALIINYFHPVSESTKRFCGWCSTVLFVNLLFHFVLFDFISFSFNQPVGQSARVHAQPDTQYTEWC